VKYETKSEGMEYVKLQIWKCAVLEKAAARLQLNPA
jgi:hypothetical protein